MSEPRPRVIEALERAIERAPISKEPRHVAVCCICAERMADAGALRELKDLLSGYLGTGTQMTHKVAFYDELGRLLTRDEARTT